MKNYLAFAMLLFTSYAMAQNSFYKTIDLSGNQSTYSTWQRPDGNFFMLATDSDSTLANPGMRLYVVDSNANLLSSKSLIDSSYVGYQNVLHLDDANFLIGACRYSYSTNASEYLIFKCDTSGNSTVLNSHKVNNSGSCREIGQLSNGNLYEYVIGNEREIIILSQSGDSLKSIVISDKKAVGIISTKENGFLAFANEYIPNTGNNAKLILYDSIGDIQWEKIYSSNRSILVYQVMELSDGYIITGKSDTNTIYGTLSLNYLLKIDKQGNLIYEKELSLGAGYGLSLNKDGNILMNSMDSKNLLGCRHYTTLLSPSGDIIWSHCFKSYIDKLGIYGFQSSSNAYYFFGIDEGDIAMIKVSPDGGHILSAKKSELKKGILCFPNPANNQLQIQLLEGQQVANLTLYDAKGNLVFTSNSLNNSIHINTSEFPEGVYFYRASNETHQNYSGKFLIQR